MSMIVLLIVFLVEGVDVTNENLTAAVRNGGSMDNVYYLCCAVCLFLIATGRANRNFMREMDAGSLDLLYLTGLRSLDIVLGKWIALGLQGLLLMIALFPFALIGYFLSGSDIPTMILRSVGLYTLFLIIISVTLADTAQEGGKAKAGKIGFTTGFIVYSLLGSTRLFSSIGTLSVFDLIIDQLSSLVGCLQIILSIIAVAFGIRLTLHRGAASIAPLFERTVLPRRLETLLFGGILCLISIRNGVNFLAASGLLIYFTYVGIITTVNLVIEKQRRIIIDQRGKHKSILRAIVETEGWRGGILIVIYLCIVLSIVTMLSGLEPWKALCIGSVTAGSTLVSRFYLMIIERKRDAKFWDFFWFQVVLNVACSIGSTANFESAAPVLLIFHIATPSTTMSQSIILAVILNLATVLAVIGLALFSPVEYQKEAQSDQEKPMTSPETAIDD
jgi:hypothetical protein